MIASSADGEPVKIGKQIVQLAVTCRHSFEWLRLASPTSLRSRLVEHNRPIAIIDARVEYPLTPHKQTLICAAAITL
jgi:hypothetical protein